MAQAQHVRVMTNTDDVEIPQGVGVIRIDRPKVNALDRATQMELISTCRDVDERRDIVVVVLYGGARVFSAGADIKQFAGRSLGETLLLGDGISQAASALAAVGQPVIAAVEGAAMGGGLEIAIAADFRVSSVSARWGLPEVLLGLMPGAGGTQRLPRIIGASRSKQLMFGGDITGKEAAAIGLVDRVCEEGEALAEALAWAGKLAVLPPLALRLMKEAVESSFETPLAPGLQLEGRHAHMLTATEDARRGITSFLEHGVGHAVFEGN